MKMIITSLFLLVSSSAFAMPHMGLRCASLDDKYVVEATITSYSGEYAGDLVVTIDGVVTPATMTQYYNDLGTQVSLRVSFPATEEREASGLLFNTSLAGDTLFGEVKEFWLVTIPGPFETKSLGSAICTFEP